MRVRVWVTAAGIGLFASSAHAAGWASVTPPALDPGSAPASVGYDPAGRLWVAAAAGFATPTAELTTMPRGGAFGSPFISPIPDEENAPSFAFSSNGVGTFVDAENQSQHIFVATSQNTAYGIGQDLGPSDFGPAAPLLAEAQSGAALIAWSENGQLVVARRSNGSGAFAPLPVPGSPADPAQTQYPVIDANGSSGLVVYSSGTVTPDYAVTYMTGGALGASSTLAQNVSSFALAQDPAGDTVVLYTPAQIGASSPVYARYRPAGGTFGPQETVAAGLNGPGPVFAGVLPNGRAVAFIQQVGGVCGSQGSIVTRTAGAGGSWGASLATIDGVPLSLSVSPAQNVYLVTADGCAGNPQSSGEMDAGLGNATSFNGTTALPGPAGSAPNPPPWGAAVDSLGYAAVVWTASSPSSISPTLVVDVYTPPGSPGQGPGGPHGSHGPGGGAAKGAFTIRRIRRLASRSFRHGLVLRGLECSQACTVTIDGAVIVLGRRRAGRAAGRHERRYGLRPDHDPLAAQRVTTVRVPLAPRVRRALLRALHHHRSVDVQLSLRSSISATRYSLTIRLVL